MPQLKTLQLQPILRARATAVGTIMQDRVGRRAIALRNCRAPTASMPRDVRNDYLKPPRLFAESMSARSSVRGRAPRRLQV